MRLYRFDPQACTALPPNPPVGIPSGMPFLLDDGTPVDVANRWLRSLPTTGVPAAKSWVAYGEDLKAWAQFLRARSLQLIDDSGLLVEAVAAYHAERRMGPLDRRLAETSWNRAVAAIARFYEWAQAEGMIDRVPFSYRTVAIRGESPVARTVRRNLAKERRPRAHVTIRWLEEEYLRLFVEVGMGGMLPDGGDDPGFRGRHAARNAAIAHLAASSGLRAQEFSHLLIWEVPDVPADSSTPFVPLTVPGVIAKGGRTRTTWVSPQALARLRGYLRLERPLAALGAPWRPDGEALVVTSADPAGGRVNGRRLRWAQLRLEERTRLVCAGGGSPLLALSDPGGPLVDWEYVFGAASRRCRRFTAHFPIVTPHVLRHSFAVHTLRWLVRTHMADVAKLLEVSDADPAWVLALRSQDPLLVLRDLLGHASVTTTEDYLRLVDTTRLFTDAELAADVSTT